MKKFTPLLFYLSVFFMAVTYYLTSIGKAEVYPFYSWKLFSKPFGSTTEDKIFRIYGLENKRLVLIMNFDQDAYDGNTKFSIINLYGKNIKMNIDKEQNLKKLRNFAKITAPQFSKYILVEESFNFQKINEEKIKINQEIITEF
ncbi:hypothetical protein [Chryseobacterium sp. MDT2-18]|uniref:hypothetical protein n=1 Tax=Chryseobacterium sp. MDT2-18 TaxID=1259136 RepID=UPI002785E501|nr:hypothetical protein [Chryseobacterium sp. MDT2-18]MDQ0477754.1 hypothetical protein [Chryseobacterium sp. MDT2-18]